MSPRGIDLTGMAYLVGIGVLTYAVYRLLKAGPAAAKEASDAVAKFVNAINPTNPQNVFRRGADAAVATATGDPHATVANKAFELLNPGRIALERDLFAPTPARPRPGQSYSALDQEDADQGAALRAALDRVSGTAAWQPADQEDADQGSYMQQAGASSPMGVSEFFSYQSRTGKNF